MGKLAAILCIVIAVCLVACSGESETVVETTPAEITESQAEEFVLFPTPTPGPASCKEVEGVCLSLTFDGESCKYSGPTEIKSGSVTTIYLNNSERLSKVAISRLDEGKTVQDVLDYIEEVHNGDPNWTKYWDDCAGCALGIVDPGKSFSVSGLLKPGIYSLVCWMGQDDYFGGGLTVAD